MNPRLVWGKCIRPSVSGTRDCSWRTLVHLSSRDSCQLADPSRACCCGFFVSRCSPCLTSSRPLRSALPRDANSTFILSYCFLITPYRLLIHPSRTLSKQAIEMESSGISNFSQLKEAQLSILIPITVMHVRVIIGLSWISQYHCKNNCLNTGYSICLDGMWMNLYKEGHKRMVCARQPAALCLLQAAEFPFLAVFVQNHDVCLCVGCFLKRYEGEMAPSWNPHIASVHWCKLMSGKLSRKDTSSIDYAWAGSDLSPSLDQNTF